jgi:ribosomal protein S18 acetylase RimI-like enzyme
MAQGNSEFFYRDVRAEGIEGVRPLWEKLNAHHADLSPRFGEAMRVRTFEVRKQKLLAKGGADGIRVDLVSAGLDQPAVAYCISTVSDDGVGEVDSIYVGEDLRGQGIGSELMRRALAWLDGKKVAVNAVSVMSDNEEALAFYRRFNFHPRAILLQQSREDAG